LQACSEITPSGLLGAHELLQLVKLLAHFRTGRQVERKHCSAVLIQRLEL
jgi:hypothetical protein